MKKYIKVFLFGLLLSPLVSLASINTNLSYGAHGQPVTELQEFLIEQGYLTGTATGNFYSLTLKAVKAYQGANSLPSTGYVGNLTRASINAELASELASSTAEATAETGTTTATTTNSSTLVSALQQQNQILQQQLQAQQQTNQLLQNQNAQTPQNQGTQNSTQSQSTGSTIVKDILLNVPSVVTDAFNFGISAKYTENGQLRNATITSDMTPASVSNSPISVQNDISDNYPLTFPTFYYGPLSAGQYTINFTANGMTKPVTVNVAHYVHQAATVNFTPQANLPSVISSTSTVYGIPVGQIDVTNNDQQLIRGITVYYKVTTNSLPPLDVSSQDGAIYNQQANIEQSCYYEYLAIPTNSKKSLRFYISNLTSSAAFQFERIDIAYGSGMGSTTDSSPINQTVNLNVQ